MLAHHHGLLEHRPHLRFARLLCRREVFVQAQLGPRHALMPSQHGLAILACRELEQHYVEAHTHHRGGGLRSSKSLPRGSDNLDTQLHLALQQLCVELLH
jgi:hypothetical protein